MSYTTIIMFVVLIGAIFLMQRSQKKQAQERQNQLNAIAKGDEVVTIGGMYAVVDEVDNDNKKIVLDVDGVFLPFGRRFGNHTGRPLNLPLLHFLDKRRDVDGHRAACDALCIFAV